MSHPRANLADKFRTALNEANQVCVSGASNRMADIIKTNGWSMFLRNFYHRKREYLKNPSKLNAQDIFLNSIYLHNVPLSKSDDYEAARILHLVGVKTIFKRKRWIFHDRFKEKRIPIELQPRIQGLDPLNDPCFGITAIQKTFLESVMWIRQLRAGNCGMRAEVIAEYLWRNPVYITENGSLESIKRIEYITLSFDHAIIVINRSGDLHDRNTWGDAWILDGWVNDENPAGIFYHVKNFDENMKKTRTFFLEQNRQMRTDFYTQIPEDKIPEQDVVKHVVMEINLSLHRYPAYRPDELKDPHLDLALTSFSDYYTSNFEVANFDRNEHKEHLDKHKEQLKKVMHELEKINCFKRIYNALYDGETTIFKRKNHWKDSKIILLPKIISYKQANPTSRTAIAWKICEEHLANKSSDREKELANKIYIHSSAKSGLFSKTRNDGINFSR